MAPSAWSRLSLRAKLTLWFLLVFGALQATLTTTAVLLRERVTDEYFDAQLLRWERAIARRLAVKQPRWIWTQQYLEAAMPLDVDLEFVVIRDATGAEVVSVGDVDPRFLPPVSHETAAAPPALVTVGAKDAEWLARVDQPLRVLTTSFQVPGGETYFIQAGATRRMLRLLPAADLDLLIVAGPISLFAAAVAAWLVAGRAVAPMKELGKAVRTLAPEHIDARVAVPHADQEVVRLQGELNEALARLEGGYRAQERFIANVAHDLKTPIAVMLTQSQVLNPDSSAIEDYEAYRKSVQEEMQHLAVLLESFLTLARVDQREAVARREPVSINDVVLESVARCEPEAQHYEVRLVPQVIAPDDAAGSELLGDPGLLCTMLDNLIRNAIRFSPARGSVDVGAVVADGHVVVTVRDRGPGIPAEFLDRIFDRFVQAPQDAARAKGTGLGLAIARSVTELHRGRIRARNLEGGGCEFEVRLPLHSAEERSEQEALLVSPPEPPPASVVHAQ